MDALSLLKEDHGNVKKLLKQLSETTERAIKTREELFAKLKRELEIHEAIEEEIIYPALKQHAEAKELILEAYEEHDVVNVILRGDPSDALPGVPGVGEKTARALVQTYPSIDAMLEAAAGDAPAKGPLAGKPALRARLRDATGYLLDMRRLVPVNSVAPLEITGGDRDDEATKAMAEKHAIRGPIQRLLAALDVVPTT